MSANLQELEDQRSGEPDSDVLDSASKAEAEKFVQRYCFGYQHKVATEDLVKLLNFVRKHR